MHKLFYFKGTRRPDFRNISRKLDYNQYWQRRGFTLRDKLMEREVIFFNWIQPNSKVVDVGCGNSRLLYELKNKKSCQVLGIDISSLVIENLRKLGIPGKVVDIQNSNFRLNYSCDYIILSEVLEHISQPEDLIQRLKNQTRYFLISIPNSAFYRYRIGLMFKGRFPTQWAQHPSEHLRYWSHIDFLDWLEAMNLDIIKIKSSNGFILKDIWRNLFGHQICYLVKSKKL